MVFSEEPWGVFALCSEAVTAAHLEATLTQPGQVRKATNLWVSSNCHVWWKRWTNVFQDFYQMYPMRVDVCVLPLPESVPNSHNLQRCLGPGFQKLGGSMSFLIAEWTNSYSNNCFLSLSLQNMWLHIQRTIVGTGDLFSVCCWSQHREDQSFLWMWIGRNSTKRDTQEKPLENWHWALNVYFLAFGKNHI